MSVWFVAGLVIVLTLKIALAWVLDLYSDEIFYWQASTRPALAYSDLPFMAALFAGLGTYLSGDSAIGVRSLFLITGSLLPALIYWLALPLVPRRQALEAALLSLCLPLGGFLGLLAVPDVPLVLFGLLMTGLLERATRKDTLVLWTAAGVIAALGFSTHYRFALFPFAAFMFLLVTPAQRHHLWGFKFWWAMAIAGIGLVPAIIFNLDTGLSGLDYHFMERHPWQFQATGLLHIFKQAGLVTPLLYIALLATLLALLKEARQGNDRSALLASFALSHLGVFLILAPWADSTRTTVHWPFSGYLPLLVFLPRTLRQWHAYLRHRFSPTISRRLTLAVPVMGFAGTLAIFAGLGSQAFHAQLQPLLGQGVLSTKMSGWKPLNAEVSRWLETALPGRETLIVADNYYTAAQIELSAGRGYEIFNIDTDKSVRDGRAMQYYLWGTDEAGLRSMTGRDALLVTEDSTLTLDAKLDVLRRACSIFAEVTFISQLQIFDGDKAFSFYRGAEAGGAEPGNPAVCPVPSQAWLDHPLAGSSLEGHVTVAGWAVNDGGGISSIRLLVNKIPVAHIERQLERADVIQALGVTNDPAMPQVGFTFELDTRTLANGRAHLALEVTAVSGEVRIFRGIRVRIVN